MAAFEIKIIPALAKPVSDIVPHALYLVKETGAEFAQLYKANGEGTAVTLFSDRVDTNKALLHVGPAVPPQGSGHRLWYDDDKLVLYINLGTDDDTWVTAFSAPTQSEFAGNGTADTMSRSDHYHNGVVVESPEW